MPAPHFLRPAQLAARRSISQTTVWRNVNRGILPHPVQISVNAVGFPVAEIDALDAAVIAGKTDDELRALVKDLELARAAAAAPRIAALSIAEPKPAQ